MVKKTPHQIEIGPVISGQFDFTHIYKNKYNMFIVYTSKTIRITVNMACVGTCLENKYV